MTCTSITPVARWPPHAATAGKTTKHIALSTGVHSYRLLFCSARHLWNSAHDGLAVYL